MICEKCKIREATISYTEIINGVKTEHHFCTQCAQEMNFGAASVLFDGEFPFSKSRFMKVRFRASCSAS